MALAPQEEALGICLQRTQLVVYELEDVRVEKGGWRGVGRIGGFRGCADEDLVVVGHWDERAGVDVSRERLVVGKNDAVFRVNVKF